jgi:hypothetical protein
MATLARGFDVTSSLSLAWVGCAALVNDGVHLRQLSLPVVLS